MVTQRLLVRLVPMEEALPPRRLGTAEGQVEIAAAFDAYEIDRIW